MLNFKFKKNQRDKLISLQWELLLAQRMVILIVILVLKGQLY